MLAIPDAKAAPAVDQRPHRDHGSLLQNPHRPPCRSEPRSRFPMPNPRLPLINARIATMGRSYKTVTPHPL
jgi:hypothetical protein